MDCSKQLVELTELEALSCDGGVNGWYITLGALGVIGGAFGAAPIAVAAGIVTIVAGIVD